MQEGRRGVDDDVVIIGKKCLEDFQGAFRLEEFLQRVSPVGGDEDVQAGLVVGDDSFCKGQVAS